MILVTSAWYNEIGFKFNFSYKVTRFIREELIINIMEPYKLVEKEKDYHLDLVVATDSKTTELEVRGPDVRKRAKLIDYGLWLPHDIINNAEYPLAEFLKYYFEALKIVFSNYNVPAYELEKIYETAKKEILNNSEYENKE